MEIRTKRIYKARESSDGYRILADRLWPRGLRKDDAQIDLWLKEVAPSTALRKWFNHEHDKYQEFEAKYLRELEGSAAFEKLLSLVEQHPVVTLLYASRDEFYNQAVTLKKFIHTHLKGA